MSPKQRDLALVQRALHDKSREIYFRLLSELFASYSHIPEVLHLDGLFRSKRYDLMYRAVDSWASHAHEDVTSHFVASQFALLIKKYPWEPAEVKFDPEAEAVRAFMNCERRCFLLNRKFALYDKLRSPNELFLKRMRDYIQFVIGCSPNPDEVESSMAFGKGASIGVHGNATHLQRKLAAKRYSCTPAAFTLAYSGLCRDSLLRELIFETRGPYSCYDYPAAKARLVATTAFVNHNKISFVPKTAKTHRAIAVEPLLNGFVQKGIDLMLRKRLKRIGIDLTDQSKNQLMAQLGSKDDSEDSFVTIDLSSASDSISIGLVRNLLPADWFYLLDSARSKEYELNGSVKTYSKFCSMGNGFCFPLETLIFVACCFASDAGTKPGRDFSVYGDDIIVRKPHANKVLSNLKMLGFLPNGEKTFLSGPFRESCGADWFGGIDVRPYTLDEKLDSLQNIFKFLNLSRRNQLATDFFGGVYDIILSYIPLKYRFFRPFKGQSDSGIDSWADQHLTSPSCKWDKTLFCWECKVLAIRPKADMALEWNGRPRSTVDMYALLVGTKPNRFHEVEYTFRRKTRTTIRFATCSGATAMWLPSM